MSSKELPLPVDNVQPEDYHKKFSVSLTSSFPCEGAAKASMKCMDKNNYDRDKCLDFFQAYRDCKKTWLEKKRTDRRSGRDVPI
ncbi:hypothetical protein CONPUDRAFT_60192 [Coniophora puteana RWD-64-598 SS2]|uniref:Cytochrome c oxidase-assembly factor COX23, mitochondrial n=1 Tax=Coniophora puteana (strain RWD-64-598) TaxID=741705 RepID=A0A5M3MJ62_CONPW|nr:uncharacterized protein CONPUDRAFT_60192 [Coniophora puteana RWD-64-598 SS2]EIW79252.1 hypothetical protein CONPUDRAFT_60192 [Coniophora puteana RWD-64-598 SS2]